MTQLSYTPRADYALLIPKTTITTGVASFSVSLAGYDYKDLLIRMALRDSANASGVTSWTFKPFTSGTYAGKYLTDIITSTVTPAVAYAKQDAAVNIPLGFTMGTGAAAGLFGHYEIEILNADDASNKYGYARLNTYENNSSAAHWNTVMWLSTDTIACDGFSVGSGAALTVAN